MTSDYKDHLVEAVDALRAAKRNLADEVAAYPTPISGCDAQFNHLLAERQRIDAALKSISGEVFIPTPRMPTRPAVVESR